MAAADEVAGAMKSWAIDRGAVYYTHWFQPMTGLTAEKHDSFISPTADGKTVLEFSGKELIKGRELTKTAQHDRSPVVLGYQ